MINQKGSYHSFKFIKSSIDFNSVHRAGKMLDAFPGIFSSLVPSS